MPDSSSKPSHSPVDWEQQARFSARMLVTLDGLWFANILEKLGPGPTLDVDIQVFQSQFKIATRLWRKVAGLDGRSAKDKVEVFRALADLYGHEFEVLNGGDHVTLRLHRCAFLENLRRAGRDKHHDCRPLCRKLAPVWFAEMEPRTGGDGGVDLGLPVGGSCCDWTVRQPLEV